MPGPLIARPTLPGWVDPAQASVFDVPGQGLLRKFVGMLGLDDPNQVMAFGTPLDVGPTAGGLVDAALAPGGPLEQLAQRFPRFVNALKTYRSPTQGGTVAQPFYSRLDEAAAALPKSTFGPKILGVVPKGLASGEELAARDVPAFVAAAGNKPIPKAALEAHLQAHPVPQLEVKTLGGPDSFQPLPDGYRIAPLAPGNRPGPQHNFTLIGPDGSGRAMYATNATDAQMIANEMLGLRERGTPTKFGQYQVPGGEHYRETLITLPSTPPDLEHVPASWRVVPPSERGPDGEFNRFFRVFDDNNDLLAYGDNHRGALVQAIKDESGTWRNDFTSSHFDEPNVLVHTRSNERTLPGLGRGTFLEEVQSDWHQKGKAEGYALSGPERAKQLKSLEQRYSAAKDGPNPDPAKVAAIMDEWNAFHDTAYGVPDAPFKETWPDLALKHHLVDAAQNPDTHWLGFTSGETQAARYDLSKQISRVEFDAGDRQLRAFDHRGHEVIRQTTGPEHLSDYIGKEAAEKLLASKPSVHPQDQTALYSLTGVDLRVGGEGMREFYDKLLPKRLEKIVKPFGGTVERVTISGDPSAPADVVARYANQPNHPFTQNQNIPAWVVKLTPELKARILKYGLPLMTGVAAVDVAPEHK